MRAAASLATVHGLEGLSIGLLADSLGISKSGLYAHFGSKRELQLAAVDEAWRIFDDEVLRPGFDASPGKGQLLKTMESYFDHLERRTFPGGCFFASAALEMSSLTGPVRSRVAESHERFVDRLLAYATEAQRRGDLDPRQDAGLLAFELSGLTMAVDVGFVLHDNADALAKGRAIVRARLGADR